MPFNGPLTENFLLLMHCNLVKSQVYYHFYFVSLTRISEEKNDE
jgi:hypothetical protein